MRIPLPILFPKGTTFFFLVGCMKSGTTWLMDVLDAHPDVVSRGEMHALEVLDNPAGPALPTLESVAAHSEALHRWWSMPNSWWNHPFRDHAGKARAHLDIDLDFVRFFFEWTLMRWLQGTATDVPKAIGDKSPSHSPHLGPKLFRYFGPYDPIVIHLVRDPRDVAVSRWFHQRKLQWEGGRDFGTEFLDAADRAACERLIRHPDHPTPKGERFVTQPRFLDNVIREWSDVNGGLLADGPRFFGDRYVLVRYEDLKSDFERVLAVLLEALRVEATPERLRAMSEANDAAKKARKTTTFRKGVVGGWRNHLAPDEAAAFGKIAALGAALGYDLDSRRDDVREGAPA